MSLLDDPTVKKTYNKCKYIVKIWEHKFIKKHKRIPSKLDIREAPAEIRNAYRKYFKLKTQALEESFVGVEGLDDDSGGADITGLTNEKSNQEESTSMDPDDLVFHLSNDHFTEEPTDKINSERIQTDLLSDNQASEDCWGRHLNKLLRADKPTSDVKASGPSKPVLSISKKLFCGSKFNKRNPRKSLTSTSLKKSVQSLDELSQSECSFQSEEIIQSFTADNHHNHLIYDNWPAGKQMISLSIVDTVLEQKEKPNLKKVDKGWLARVEQSTRTNYDSDDIVEDSDDEQPITKKSRLSTFKHFSSYSQSSLTTNVSFNEDMTQTDVKLEINQSEEQQQQHEQLKSKIESHSLRTSTRETKTNRRIVVNDFDEEEEKEDPYASDNDPNDPEFVIVKNKQKKMKRFSSLNESLKKAEKPQKKTKDQTKNKQKTPIQIETTCYELEYNVKPRVVAPRCDDLKNLLKDNLNQKTTEQHKTTEQRSNKRLTEMEKKLSSGTVNDNYRTINLRKKTFSRGHKQHNHSKYKKIQWKNKKKALYGPDMDMGGCDGGKLICFHCGQEGHFAQKCPQAKESSLLPYQEENEEQDQENIEAQPTLEEASKMARESELKMRKSRRSHDETVRDEEEQAELDEEEAFLLAEVEKLEEHVKKLDVADYVDMMKVVEPYYDQEPKEVPENVLDVLEKFGHQAFRPGQAMAIMRILSGKSTLVTLSTGSGKSLCYQLPAYMYSQRRPCISLVISPLVSLMEDQITGIPKFLKAVCLHTNQTATQRSKILEAIAMGEVNILLISPEAIVAGEKQSGFGSLLRKLPPIAFACIDEAHCVSQWSHNFRPSYLLICRVLKESLGVKTILGLTATATRATCRSIATSLGIPDDINGIIGDIPLPDNLKLSASKVEDRDRSLLKLLQSDRMKNCRSIIVYCTRREECERIASFLRTSLKYEGSNDKDSQNKKRKRLNLQAEPYHAGMSASRRRTVQNAFMSGDLRLVVATVAFGMGINKSDIRAVIHFNMPNSFESYVQEVGRAGRDGLPAYCHVFLRSTNQDESELRRHIHANSIDRHVIRKLLRKIFVSCSCKSSCPKHEVAFSIEKTVRYLDISEEIISTLLCYLELHPKNYVKLLNPAYTICKVISYGGVAEIRNASKTCPPLAMALALHPSSSDQHQLEFPVVDVASVMGWDSGICKHKLKNLEWASGKRSKLTVQFMDLGFRLLAPGNLSDDELDETLDNLYSQVRDQETKALKQLCAVHKALTSVTNENNLSSSFNDENNSNLKTIIRDYFRAVDPLATVILESAGIQNEDLLVNDIKALITMYRDTQFTGRAVARIFHGIQSPNYPAVIWGRCKFWRRHLSDDFHDICRIATREILKMR